MSLSRPCKVSTKTFGYIEHQQSPDAAEPKVANRCDLSIACPVDGCKQKKRQWKCSKCDSLVQFGVTDRNFYCDCGKLTIKGCKYKCYKHEFKQADGSQLIKSLAQLVLSSPRKEFTCGHIKHQQSPNPEAPRAINRCDLIIACPTDGCKEKKQWKCSKCHAPVEYGITDNNFYCDCGKLAIDGCTFKCPKHEFKQADTTQLKESLAQLKPPREFNLLIMGETGVGKSTFINAFANYLFYATLDDAMKGSLITLIYNERKVTDNNMQVITITNGKKTSEEVTAPGQSATQRTKVHRFCFENIVIRIIDTPGIGDVKGAVRDDENFKDILNTIPSYPELNAIMILLKPNSARLTLTFRYCIEELLRHLHKSAAANIIFGFTNSRGTDFGDGDTMPALLEHLKEIKAEININRDKVYYFESEGYRFLGEHFHGLKKSERLINNYRESWTKSVDEVKRLLEYITQLKPHRTQETLSLNSARLLILQLTKPMAEITKLIVVNSENLKREQDRINDLADETEDLEYELMVDKIDYDPIKLQFPRTVCTDRACTKETGKPGRYSTNYVTWCHDHCYLEDVKEETTNVHPLANCAAMDTTTGICMNKRCSHHYTKHMHIKYELKEITVKTENWSVRQLLDRNASLVELKEESIDGIQETLRELKDEHLTIEKTAAQFGAFLERNAITAYSDARLDYLQSLIDEEKGKAPQYRNEELLAALVESLRMYKEEVDILEKAIAQGKNTELLEIAEIQRSVAQLYGLKHSGPTLRKLKNTEEEASVASNREQNHKFNSVSRKSGIVTSITGEIFKGCRGQGNDPRKNF